MHIYSTYCPCLSHPEPRGVFIRAPSLPTVSTHTFSCIQQEDGQLGSGVPSVASSSAPTFATATVPRNFALRIAWAASVRSAWIFAK